MLLRSEIINLANAHLYYYPTPLNLTYFWGLGSLSGIFLVFQMVSGILLAMYYIPEVILAFESINYIMREVNIGWFFRYIHSNGASFFFFIVYLHIARTLYFGFYYYQRKFLWFSGILLFIVMMATAFMGYVLPWGQMSFWGATVITNLFSAIPYVGEPFALWLWGGYSVGGATLTRFFSLHYCLPFVLAGISLFHLIFLHSIGSSNPFGLVKVTDKITFYPYFYVKDYLGLLVILFVFGAFIFWAPEMLNHSDNYIEGNPLITPIHIVPEWYFLPFYAILRSVPNKLGGVIVMFLALLIYFTLPFGFRTIRSLYSSTRWIYNNLIWYFFFIVIILGILGGRPIEDPYIIVAQILVFNYFLFFFFIIWLDGFLIEFFDRFSIDFTMQNNSVMLNFFSGSNFLSLNFLKTQNKSNTNFQMANSRLSIIKHFMDTNKPAQTSFFFLLLEQLKFYQLQMIFGNLQITEYFRLKYSLFVQACFRILQFGHPFHLVTESPWPFLLSISFFGFFLGLVGFFHNFITYGLFLSFIMLCLVLTGWFLDIIKEATFEGAHTLKVQKGIKIGVILFIVSEIMFFFSFFWAFFHSSLSPAIEIGGIWPPLGIETFNPWGVPLVNTVILLTSGITVTWAHYAIQHQALRYKSFKNKKLPLHYSSLISAYFLLDNRLILNCFEENKSFIGLRKSFQKHTLLGLFLQNYVKILLSLNQFSSNIYIHYSVNYFYKSFLTTIVLILALINSHFIRFFKNSRIDTLIALTLTIMLGLLFTEIQFYEYLTAPFNISDSIFGSTFFLTTGFHGLHVLVGTIFLIVALIRTFLYHFTRQHHIGLESAIWYWHFVDVVWLGLYISIYHWGI